jgi:hypothetical protein
LRVFTQEREWDRYHTPKNLAMALIVEAAELAEHFQWLTASIETGKYVNRGHHSEATSLMSSICQGFMLLFTNLFAFSQYVVYA